MEDEPAEAAEAETMTMLAPAKSIEESSPCGSRFVFILIVSTSLLFWVLDCSTNRNVFSLGLRGDRHGLCTVTGMPRSTVVNGFENV